MIQSGKIESFKRAIPFYLGLVAVIIAGVINHAQSRGNGNLSPIAPSSPIVR